MHVANREDWIIILLFLGAVACVYGAAIFILLRFWLSPKSRRPAIGPSGVLVLVTSIFGMLCIAYGLFIEPYQLDVTSVSLPIKGLHSEVVAVHISDLHSDTTPRLEQRVAKEIELVKPNLIFYTGDSINSLDALPVFSKFANSIQKVAPVFCVKGDWDFAFPQYDVLGKSPFTKLGNESKVVTVNDNKLCLIGCDSGTDCLPTVKSAPKGLPTIMLFHNPDADVVLTGQTDSIDLYLCGHTHGGQIALPFYGALITQSIQGKKYEQGLHKLKNMWLYTCRGIGMEGHFPRIRFFSKPQMTVFHLVPSLHN